MGFACDFPHLPYISCFVPPPLSFRSSSSLYVSWLSLSSADGSDDDSDAACASALRLTESWSNYQSYLSVYATMKKFPAAG
jgi:hypothetical protein